MIEKRNEGGFTLIELLIVIIILAILAAIVVFAVGSTGSNAVAASCNADAKTFETALESYKAAVGAYPGAASLNNAASPSVAEINNGQDWPSALPTGGVLFGLLGNNGYSAGNMTFGLASPVPDTTPAATWTATNQASVGPFLRELPSGAGRPHYQVVTDGLGGVFVVPPSKTGAIPNPLPSGDNYDTNPSICNSYN